MSESNNDPWGPYFGFTIIAMFVGLGVLTRVYDWSWYWALGSLVGVLYVCVPAVVVLVPKAMDYIDRRLEQPKKPNVVLKACLNSAKACRRLLKEDPHMLGSITSLSRDIDRYGRILLGKAESMRHIANVSSDEQTKMRLNKMADERESAVRNIANKFQRLIPSVISGHCVGGIEEIESDLELMRNTIDKANNEMDQLTKPVLPQVKFVREYP